MVVDDSPIVRERLISLLSEIPGVEVVGEADTAAKAIATIPSLNPSVVILDISMPGGSGLLVLEALQKCPEPPLIIVLTNFAHDLYRKRCIQLGATCFFDKSSEFEAIKELLQPLPVQSAV